MDAIRRDAGGRGYRRERAVWVRTPEGSLRLWPAVATPHRFRAIHGWVSFELEDGRAQTARYEVDEGMILEAMRVD